MTSTKNHKGVLFELTGHIFIVEFHCFVFHLIDALPEYDLPKLEGKKKGELLKNEDCESIRVQIEKKESSKQYDSVKFPKRYSDIMFFYIFDDSAPIFFPCYEYHILSPKGVILKDVFLKVNRKKESSLFVPQLMLNEDMGDIVSIKLYSDERCFEFSMEFQDAVLSPPILKNEYRISDRTAIFTDGLVDLRPICPPICDQADLGTCGVAAIVSFLEFVTGCRLSVLFLYYTTRILKNYAPHDDSGVELIDCLEALELFGICTEKTWPYITSNFLKKPPEVAYEEAKLFKPTRKDMKKVSSLEEIKNLLRNGMVTFLDVMFTEETYGKKTYETGIIPPAPTISYDEVCVHSCLIVGYDDKNEQLFIQNSWGTDWGIEGYGILPYDYIRKNLFQNAYTWISSVKDFHFFN